MTCLLDANVLIALTIDEHEHHGRASTWLATAGDVALCPVVEGSLIRFLVRIGESVQMATEVLRRWHAHPRCEFWSDSVSFIDADLSHVRGHRQVTDAYLTTLVAAREGALLATMDESLVRDQPELTLLVPTL